MQFLGWRCCLLRVRRLVKAGIICETYLAMYFIISADVSLSCGWERGADGGCTP